MRFLAIDPGDRHVGIAQLHLVGRTWKGRSLIFDRQERQNPTLYAFMNRRLWPRILESELVVCEDFQFRQQGFNAFASGQTLRLLGAIETITMSEGRRFQLVAPGSPEKARLLWPRLKDEQLFRVSPHAMSAWRVLGQYLLSAKSNIPLEFTGELL